MLQYLTTVGDARQSIYRFRSACSSDVKQRFQKICNLVLQIISAATDFAICRKVCSADGMIANFMDLSLVRKNDLLLRSFAHSPRDVFWLNFVSQDNLKAR